VLLLQYRKESRYASAQEFTPWDFIKMVKELNEHEAELKIKLARAGVDSSQPLRDSKDSPSG
jgi:hypothetical protein